MVNATTKNEDADDVVVEPVEPADNNTDSDDNTNADTDTDDDTGDNSDNDTDSEDEYYAKFEHDDTWEATTKFGDVIHRRRMTNFFIPMFSYEATNRLSRVIGKMKADDVAVRYSFKIKHIHYSCMTESSFSGYNRLNPGHFKRFYDVKVLIHTAENFYYGLVVHHSGRNYTNDFTSCIPGACNTGTLYIFKDWSRREEYFKEILNTNADNDTNSESESDSDSDTDSTNADNDTDSDDNTNADNDKTACDICNALYEGYGNNAKPLYNGRCCNQCNRAVIIFRIGVATGQLDDPNPRCKEDARQFVSICRDTPF